MDRLRKSLRESFRRKKDHIPESSKPHQWQADEQAVRAGNCCFHVKYLGCVEVFESRGMHVCEEALRVLRNSRRRSIKGILFITGDGLRVVDDETKGLIVDQTIEKVSFCAPDRNHEKGFSYICRDGTTRRWMCHGFHATKDSGERLSHAVGCAFAVCLERKQKRDKESVTMNFDAKTSTFTRTGSFRQSSLTERLQDPQECKPVEPIPVKAVHNPFAIERPHATPQLLQRQGSFRGFDALNQSSPFKRQLSLRANDLTSTCERQRSHSLESSDLFSRSNGSKVTPIPEVSPIVEKQDTISAMCQELSLGLKMLSNNDDSISSSKLTANSTFVTQTLAQMQNVSKNPTSGKQIVAQSWLSHSTTATNELNDSPVIQDVGSNIPVHQIGRNIPNYSPNLSQTRSQSVGSSADAFTSKNSAFNLKSMTNDSSANKTNGSARGSYIAVNELNKPKDPFDAEWVALANRHQSNHPNRSTNPFSQNTVKAFEVQM